MNFVVNIDRVKIAMHGISAQVVEAAVNNLENELKRRLGALSIGYGLTSRYAFVDIGELALGPVRSEAVLDAGSLRGIIADRLVQAIQHRLSNQEGVD